MRPRSEIFRADMQWYPVELSFDLHSIATKLKLIPTTKRNITKGTKHYQRHVTLPKAQGANALSTLTQITSAPSSYVQSWKHLWNHLWMSITAGHLNHYGPVKLIVCSIDCNRFFRLSMVNLKKRLLSMHRTFSFWPFLTYCLLRNL